MMDRKEEGGEGVWVMAASIGLITFVKKLMT
jgi:hypothetical protein